jgi:hypothetical protein
VSRVSSSPAIVRLDAEQPGGIGVGIHRFRRIDGGLVGGDHLARHRRVDVRGGLHRFDHGAFLAGLDLAADVRQFEEDDVAQRFLGVVGDADGDVPSLSSLAHSWEAAYFRLAGAFIRVP